ncbi:helix-turn-helix domain-containing protein [Chloroflexota bacterium]
MEENLERIVYTVDETAKILGLSRPAAFQGVKQGSIPHVRVGKRILVPKAALEKMMATAGQS